MVTDSLIANFVGKVLAHGATVSAIYAFTCYERFHERELAAWQLEAQLAEKQL